MLDVLLTSSISFIITFLAIPVVLQIAEQKHLFDAPDERKIHTQVIASLGGVGIFGGFLMACMLSIQGYLNPEFQYFFAAALIIFFLGLKDDLAPMSATKKIIGQVLAASVLVHLADVRLTSMHGFLGIDGLPEGFSMALSYLSIIVIINSFNLIDGIDGLASSLGILTMLVFGTYFFLTGQQAYALMAFSLCGGLIAFLIFNHHPAKIFMGDSGSLMIGMVNAICVIRFINTASNPDLPSAFLDSSVAIGFSILFIPLVDTLRVFGIRIFSGRSPFSPDRNHIHHLLLDWGLGHSAVTLICVGLNICFIVIAYTGKSLGTTSLLAIMFSIAFATIGFLYFRKPVSVNISKAINDPDEESPSTTKIVPIGKAVSRAENK